MMTRRIKVDTRAIKKAFNAIEDQISNAATEAIREVAEAGRDYATELFAAAEYDGENDVVVSVRDWKSGMYVVASGKALPFIEYGTGTGDYWYFAGKGRDIQLNSTGLEYHHRYVSRRVKTESVTQYRVIGMTDRAGNDIFLQEAQHKNVKRDKYGDYIMHPRLGRVALSAFQVEGDYTGETKTEKVERETVYNTEGNPPNDVMVQTREYIREVGPDIIREYIGRLG